MKHPKPWTVYNYAAHSPDYWQILDACGTIVLRGVKQKTALEIVRAVNAHEALVGALNKISKYGCFDPTRSGPCDCPTHLACQALTLAKEPT